MSEQHFYFITDPLKNHFSLYPQETKWFYFRDKILSGNLDISFMHRNTTSCVVLLHGILNNIQMQDLFSLTKLIYVE